MCLGAAGDLEWRILRHGEPCKNQLAAAKAWRLLVRLLSGGAVSSSQIELLESG